jgi:Na+-translocating ferredoxin:NAD+ oxidoreductase RNF subunit RnfB
MIVKQSSIKVASDLCIAEGKTDVNSVIAKAEEIIKWVMAEKKEVKQEFTKVQPKDDLPF